MTPQQNISILIIEDNPGDQLLLEEKLKSTNLSITNIVTADNLAAGISQLNKQNFSLIFLDLFLPDSIGLLSFSELIKTNSRVPVVIYSGLSDSEIALKAINAGAQDFLTKGDFSVSLLEKTVLYSIERKANLDALEESNEKFNLISKATHDMVWDWDLVTGEVARNTEGWKKIFKTDKKTKIGTKEDWRAKTHPDDLERSNKVFNEIINSKTQDVFEMELRIVRDDGTIGHIQDRGYLIRNELGKAIRIIGATLDITERKLAEEKVLLRKQRYKSLVQNSTDLLGVLDAEGNYLYVSPSSKKILGIEPAFFIGKNAFTFIHDDDIQQTQTSLAQVLEGSNVDVPLFRFKNAAGEWRWIESTITNLLNDGAVGGIVVNSRDVTEKKIADDELSNLSLIAKETINGILIMDNEYKVTWANNAFTKMSEYELSEIIGLSPLEFFSGPETDNVTKSFIREKLGYYEPFVFDKLNYTKRGNKIFMKAQLQPTFHENGTLKQYIAIITDITKQKELEYQIELQKLIKQKEITEAVFTAQENERSHIGRELHDNVNQLLGATHLYINMARKNEEGRDSLLDSATSSTYNAIQEIRKLSKTLITPLLEDAGLIDSIRYLTEEIMLVHPIKIMFNAIGFIEDGLSQKFKLNIFRIIQEQINNILKHAKAKNITIIIEESVDKILFSLTDDGTGFDIAKRKPGVGITNIKSRCELYNCIMLLTSTPGKGTKLSITFNKIDSLNNNPIEAIP